MIGWFKKVFNTKKADTKKVSSKSSRKIRRHSTHEKKITRNEIVRAEVGKTNGQNIVGNDYRIADKKIHLAISRGILEVVRDSKLKIYKVKDPVSFNKLMKMNVPVPEETK